MASLFSPKQNSGVNDSPSNNQNGIFGTQPQPQQDSISYAEQMLRRSGGDAKAAFYLAAKEKGLDPDKVLAQINGMGNMKSMAMNAMMANPNVQRLMSLFSITK